MCLGSITEDVTSKNDWKTIRQIPFETKKAVRTSVSLKNLDGVVCVLLRRKPAARYVCHHFVQTRASTNASMSTGGDGAVLAP